MIRFEGWIVRVAMRSFGVKRVYFRFVQWSIHFEPLWQIRIGYEQSTVRDSVGVSQGQDLPPLSPW
jgi:hypothetical protein